ncbi:efflux RND transporter periplasmic adaptor subunit [Synoicihabitans lomoniglobus]|uniref:Efflux RND transporter periplasmic adaptor subunit n=1 Tax=Synoicihabitans lomoniglobus TaxID=2909285 RepID=A0AAF0CR90_9BACT|nr:efflux RND transporter periplasmic adaptor subunit [Opitutaceae bacterium LMO-M01]WED66588.1 efflux RND transporter periplasmic adaptor subunit [Opitutaceae bacterium LMO-M01]
MNWKLTFTLVAIVAVSGGIFYSLQSDEHDSVASSAHGHGHDDHDDHHDEEAERGAHGGRLLTDGDFTLELAIVEAGMPPEFRAWATVSGREVPPADVRLSVELMRPGGATDHHAFVVEGDYLRGQAEVYEPHSFDYRVSAVHAGRQHDWNFEAPEMQTTLTAAAAARAGVETEVAGPATFTTTLPVYGRVKFDADHVARAVPRFSGIVREARKVLGDTVTAGEVVAVVETNQSLATIEVKAPLAGTIVARDVNAGETVEAGAALYTIADLSRVWLDLNIPKRDQARVRPGQTVMIHADDGGAAATGTIDWLSPISDAEAQTLVARVILPNPDQRWRPGLFITASVELESFSVPIAVPESALQTVFDFTVVFSQHGEVYQARPLELGRRSQGMVEVLKGLRAGETYVTANSFLIKADIGKAGASHDH